MIPPEPTPDPPVPPVAENTYSYDSSIGFLLNDTFEAVVYRTIKDEFNNSNAYVSGTLNGSPITFNNLIIWTNAFDETVIGYATDNANQKRYLILDSNSDLGLTVPLYQIDFADHNTLSQTENVVYVESSTPSDYYANLKSGDYTLIQRS